MIGFMKNLFSGILSFFIGLLGGNKSQENKPGTTASAEKLKEATTSSAEKLKEATTSSAEKLKEATTSSAEKLKEATTSSAEKLKEATGKNGSGILSSLSGLVDGKKSQENKPSQTPLAEKPTAATGKKRKRSGYFMELDEAEEIKPVKENQPAQAAKTPEPVNATKPAKAEPAKTPELAAAEAASAKVQLVQTAEGVKVEAASASPAANTNGQNQTETTFAPKYLAPSGSSNSRRRPGPNMNPFLDMARQVKTPG